MRIRANEGIVSYVELAEAAGHPPAIQEQHEANQSPPSIDPRRDSKPGPLWLWSGKDSGARSSGERGRRAGASVTRGERELDTILETAILKCATAPCSSRRTFEHVRCLGSS